MPAGDLFHFKAGVYRHYKGELYQALGLAQSSGGVSEGELQVVYVCLYTHKGGPYLRTRPLREWLEIVNWKMQRVNRFSYIGTGELGEDGAEPT